MHQRTGYGLVQLTNGIEMIVWYLLQLMKNKIYDIFMKGNANIDDDR